MREYDVYLFDWDGTLADSTAVWLGIIRAERHAVITNSHRRPHETVLMLGDADRDILAAHQAGVDSLLYYPRQHQQFHDLEQLRAHNPTHIITSWKELTV